MTSTGEAYDHEPSDLARPRRLLSLSALLDRHEAADVAPQVAATIDRRALAG
ncbi:MAG: hypothetical protein ACYCU6_04300 [Acidimicrobiales bacterium]